MKNLVTSFLIGSSVILLMGCRLAETPDRLSKASPNISRLQVKASDGNPGLPPKAAAIVSQSSKQAVEAMVRTNGRPIRDDIERTLKELNFRATFPERPQAEPKQANRLPRQVATSQAPVPKAVEFTLRGMTCEACAITAEKALAKISGVEKVAVDFDSKTVKLTTRGAVSADQVREALKPSGFEAQFLGDAPPPKSLPRQVVTSQAPVPKAVEFTLRGMTCEACATTAEKALAKISGVEKVAVDFDSKTVKLTTRGEVSADQVREALKPSGFEALFPSDAPPPKSISTRQKRSLDIQLISRGEKIRIADHLVAGKFTLFDFFAEWCGPCHLLTPKLERLVRDRGNVALRTVDLVDWKSAAAKQATREFKLPALPYVRVYGPKGDFLGAVEGNRIEQIEKLVTGSTNR